VFTLTSLFHALASEGTSSSNATERNIARRDRKEYACPAFIIINLLCSTICYEIGSRKREERVKANSYVK
jgi:hypothetical protein